MATTTLTPTIDKRTAAQTIRHLMELWGIDWEELKELDLPAEPSNKGEIPPIWDEVFGILKNHPIDPLAYEDQIRSEWDNYP